jgi:hypothetical protein
LQQHRSGASSLGAKLKSKVQGSVFDIRLERTFAGLSIEIWRGSAATINFGVFIVSPVCVGSLSLGPLGTAEALQGCLSGPFHHLDVLSEFFLLGLEHFAGTNKLVFFVHDYIAASRILSLHQGVS